VTSRKLEENMDAKRTAFESVALLLVMIGASLISSACASVPKAQPHLWRELRAKQQSTGLAIAVGTTSNVTMIWLDRPDHTSDVNASDGYYRALWIDDTGQRIIADNGRELRIVDTAWRLIRSVRRVPYKALALSPDGVHIAIVEPSSSGLSILNSETGVRTPVALRGVKPSWSPDGSKLVFEELNPGEEHVPAQYANAERMLSIFSLGAARTTFFAMGINPNWSPDGRWIAYCSRGRILLANAETATVLRRLFSSWSNVRWSPDSEYLVFVENPIELLGYRSSCFQRTEVMVYRFRDGKRGSVHRTCQLFSGDGVHWVLNKDITKIGSRR
jgi:dipeptidyl aminopeptidase/acylaminoacyl peptidase